jgi:hypothetical protein
MTFTVTPLTSYTYVYIHVFHVYKLACTLRRTINLLPLFHVCPVLPHPTESLLVIVSRTLTYYLDSLDPLLWMFVSVIIITLLDSTRLFRYVEARYPLSIDIPQTAFIPSTKYASYHPVMSNRLAHSR